MSFHPIIIAFTGKKGCGKSTAVTTAALHLKKYFKIHNISFAAPLKTLITDVFCLSNNECYDTTLKEVTLEHWNVSPRELMQKIGTDLFRNHLDKVCPDLKMPAETIWSSNVYCKIKQIEFENRRNNITNSFVLIDDCRFNDEYNTIKRLGGIVIKIKVKDDSFIPFKRRSINPFRNYVKRSSARRESSMSDLDCHDSEKGCKYDYKIENNHKCSEEFDVKLLNLLSKIINDRFVNTKLN